MDNNTDYDNLLNSLKGVDNTARMQAESIIDNLVKSDYGNTLLKFSQIISDENIANDNRQLSSIIMKNYITREYLRRWNMLDYALKSSIRCNLLNVLASNGIGNKYENVKRSVGVLIASIYKVELRKWDDLIDQLANAGSNFNEENENVRESAIETLGYISEELSGLYKNKDSSSFSYTDVVDKILTCVFTCIDNALLKNNEKILLICLKTLYTTIPVAGNNFKKNNERDLIINIIMNIADKYISTSEKIIELVLKNCIQICSLYYSDISTSEDININMSKITQLSFYVINNNNFDERIRLFSYEIWCVIGELELSYSDVLDSDTKSSKYFEKFSSDLIKILLNNISMSSNTNTDNEDEDWTISKACAYILSILVQLTDSSILEDLLIYVENNFHSEDKHIRNSALIILGCCLETIHKDKIANLLKFNFDNFFNTLSDKDKLVRNTSSWLLCKITELYPYIFDKTMLVKHVPIFLNIISDDTESENQSNKVKINICIALMNIIEFYGDKKTVKNSNAMTVYYLPIIDILVKTAYKKESFNKDFNLSFYCFQVMVKIIEFSSQDFQEHLEVILEKFTEFYEEINIQLENNTTNLSSENLYNLQENECLVISQIYTKIIRKVKSEYCTKVYNSIIKSFKIKNNVIEVGLSCISQIALNLKEEFIPFTSVFIEYLIYSLKKYDEYLLCKTAVIATSNLVIALELNFSNYIDLIIPILIDILANENINRTIKTTAISTLGDISMNIPNSFIPYMENIMMLLLSACEITTQIPSDEDEDTIEYLAELRLALIECFTSISFGLKEVNQEQCMNVYLVRIFNYLRTFTNDLFNPDKDLLKNIIAYVADIADIYGKEAKMLINQDFVINTLNKLKQRKTNSTIEWAEEVITKVISFK